MKVMTMKVIERPRGHYRIAYQKPGGALICCEGVYATEQEADAALTKIMSEIRRTLKTVGIELRQVEGNK